jgi:hypothetical protein
VKKRKIRVLPKAENTRVRIFWDNSLQTLKGYWYKNCLSWADGVLQVVEHLPSKQA